MNKCCGFVYVPYVTPETTARVSVAPKNNMAGPWVVSVDAGGSSFAFHYRLTSEGPEMFGAGVVRSERVIPTEMQRLPWAKWSTVAREALRRELAGLAGVPVRREEPLMAAIEDALGADKQPRAPRRRGPKPAHDDDFYRRLADRYSELLAEGEPHPSKRLAAEKHFEASTMRTFIRRARERGFLPPAQHGKAG